MYKPFHYLHIGCNSTILYCCTCHSEILKMVHKLNKKLHSCMTYNFPYKVHTVKMRDNILHYTLSSCLLTNILCSCLRIDFMNMFCWETDKILVDIIYMLSLSNKFGNLSCRYFNYNVVLWPLRLNLSTVLSIDRCNILYTF